MRSKILVLSCLALLGAAAPAAADPTVQLTTGRTRVTLDAGFIGALNSLGVEAEALGVARLRQGEASFPVRGGAIDLATLAGDIFHTGGLALLAGTTEVRLLNFIIDTQEEPVLTGLVVVNGDLIGRVPLFDLAPQSSEVARGRIAVAGVEVTLGAAAADALNDIFGVDAFEEGLRIGEASVEARVLKRDRRDLAD